MVYSIKELPKSLSILKTVQQEGRAATQVWERRVAGARHQQALQLRVRASLDPRKTVAYWIGFQQ